MGYGRWDAAQFQSFTRAHTAGRTASQVFTTSSLLDEFDPAKFATREARDSAANPKSTPIMLFSDVTGSMGVTAEHMIRSGIDTVMKEIDARRPVPDPQILVGAIGDAYTDRAPLQMTQFEAGVVLADQLKRVYVEGGGGGNGGESYLGAHYAAGMKTSVDSWEKRGKKGFLFTMGDEPNHSVLTKEQIERVFGIRSERDLTSEECLALAQRQYEVFHIVFTDVGHAAGNLGSVTRTWEPLLGERMILLEDHSKVAEVVVSTLQVLAGEAIGTVANSWSGKTALVVANSLGGLTKGNRGGGGFRRL